MGIRRFFANTAAGSSTTKKHRLLDRERQFDRIPKRPATRKKISALITCVLAIGRTIGPNGPCPCAQHQQEEDGDRKRNRRRSTQPEFSHEEHKARYTQQHAACSPSGRPQVEQVVRVFAIALEEHHRPCEVAALLACQRVTAIQLVGVNVAVVRPCEAGEFRQCRVRQLAAFRTTRMRTAAKVIAATTDARTIASAEEFADRIIALVVGDATGCEPAHGQRQAISCIAVDHAGIVLRETKGRDLQHWQRLRAKWLPCALRLYVPYAAK